MQGDMWSHTCAPLEQHVLLYYYGVFSVRPNMFTKHAMLMLSNALCFKHAREKNALRKGIASTRTASIFHQV